VITTSHVVAVTGRVLLAALFVLAGSAKALGPQPYLAHMAEIGVPGFLLPGVIALEIGAGAALAIGWRPRDAAGALAVFCLLTAVIFHHQLGDRAERTQFIKDIALSGALMAIAAGAARPPRREPDRD
jgi:putative oxidoreductase